MKINISQMVTKLLYHKLEKAKVWVAQVVTLQNVSQKNFKSLFGFLLFASKAVFLWGKFIQILFSKLPFNKK